MAALNLQHQVKTMKMRRVSLLFPLFFILPTGLIAQPSESGIHEDLTISSEKMGYDVHYSLYLPPGYGTSNRRYPVVYLLHGYSDDDSGWVQFGKIQHYADKAILAGEIPPMIIVMPDAKVTWYVNSYDGKMPYEDFFVEEFIPHIDAAFPTRAKKEFRGVAGLSMGGHGTLVYLTRHADLFAAGAAFSAAVMTDEEVVAMDDARYNAWFSKVYGPEKKPENRANEAWKKYSIFHIIKSTPLEELKKVRYYIDCGDDDFLYKGNDALHTLMRDKGIPHEYRVRDGGHRWEYWRTGITNGLKFIGESFHR